VLDAGPAPLSLEAFARVHKVTAPAVKKWIAAGMPAKKSPGPDGQWSIDAAAAGEWVKLNRSERGHGGARGGSGRKAKGPRSRAAKPEGDGGAAKAEGAVDGERDEQQELELERAQELSEGDDVAKFLDRTPVSDPEFIPKAFKAGLRKASVDRLVRLIEVQQKTVELQIKTRGMVSVSAVAERLGGKLARARSVVESAPLRIAEAVAGEARLEADAVAVLSAALRRELALMMRELAAIDAKADQGAAA